MKRPAWRTFRVLRLGLVLVAIAGCGVQPSGVITGAGPPSGPVRATGTTTLYFVANGQPSVVQRSGTSSSRAEALAQLAAGPTADERADGFTTDVPRGAAPFSVELQQAGRLVVRSSLPVDELSTTAVAQLVCTAAATMPGGGGSVVTVVEGDQSRGPQTCPASG